MKSIKEYLQSVNFSLGYTFRFAKIESIIYTILFVVPGVFPYLSAYLLGNLINTIVDGATHANYEGIWPAIIFYALITAIPGIIGNINYYVNRRRVSKLQVETELDILKHRERMDIARYEDPKFQDLVQRTFRTGPNPIYQLAATQFDIMRALLSLIVGTILAARFNSWVYLLVILTAVPSFITDIKFASLSWSIWAKDSPEQRRFGDLRQHIFWRIFLIEVKLMQAGKKLLDWMRKILTEFSQKQMGMEKKRLFYASITDLISLVGFVGGIIIVVKSVISGKAPVGTIVYMMGTLTSVRSSIGFLLESISGQYENHLIIQDMIKFMNTEPVVVDSKNPKKLQLKSAPEIIFENVGFKYRGSDKYSLQNINLTFNAGENIGLVGNNGAGKTTLVKLLCRIYEPTEGRILVDGVDLKEVATSEWWSYLAVMFQDYASYDFLVKDAIAISRPEKPTNLTKVIEAAKVSQSHDFIMEWKDKYDEQLGIEFSGKEPSKGQRQKLSIAKILYRDGLVMILDEPTASVDAESEAKIFDSIENLPKDRTAILISHDFSTISQCDKIFVLDKGTLIEEGSHKQLIKNKGIYSELYHLQAKRFKK